MKITIFVKLNKAITNPFLAYDKEDKLDMVNGFLPVFVFDY